MATWTHSPTVRLRAIAAVAVLLAGTASNPPAAESVVRPEITLLGNPTVEERDMVDWAAARFLDAGLQLPDLSVEFAVGCGCRGTYNRATQTIQVCDGRKMTLLHEMAHSWDHFATFDRSGFLELRGLEVYSATQGIPASDVGEEHVAEILAWGLMDDETAVPGPAYPSQPVADYQPRLLGLPNSDLDQLHGAFVFLTNIEPLRG